MFESSHKRALAVSEPICQKWGRCRSSWEILFKKVSERSPQYKWRAARRLFVSFSLSRYLPGRNNLTPVCDDLNTCDTQTRLRTADQNNRIAPTEHTSTTTLCTTCSALDFPNKEKIKATHLSTQISSAASHVNPPRVLKYLHTTGVKLRTMMRGRSNPTLPCPKFRERSTAGTSKHTCS